MDNAQYPILQWLEYICSEEVMERGKRDWTIAI